MLARDAELYMLTDSSRDYCDTRYAYRAPVPPRPLTHARLAKRSEFLDRRLQDFNVAGQAARQVCARSL